MNQKLKQFINCCAVAALLSGCASSGGGNDGSANETQSNVQNGSTQNGGTNVDQQTEQINTNVNTDGSVTSGDTNTDNTEIIDTDVNPVLLESDYPADPEEIARTFNASLVKFPDGNGGVITGSIAELEDGSLTSATQLPVVIYLHGCSGFFTGSDFRMDWLARQGFVSIAPNSFARTFYPESCSLATRQGWLYKPTIEMRLNDAANAIEQIRAFPWVDQENVFLYGFSEGGVIAATLNSSNPLQQARARVIEGWNCITIPWPEYSKVSVPESEPVLSLFADKDPWLQGQILNQHCGDFLSQTNGSQSFLIDYAPLNSQHTLLEAPEIQEIVLNFLLQQLSAP